MHALRQKEVVARNGAGVTQRNRGCAKKFVGR
jgi:hypothetical protein